VHIHKSRCICRKQEADKCLTLLSGRRKHKKKRDRAATKHRAELRQKHESLLTAREKLKALVEDTEMEKVEDDETSEEGGEPEPSPFVPVFSGLVRF
jgi:hypothetical protein